MKKVIYLLSMVIIMSAVVLFISPDRVQAKVSAKKVIAKALEKMQNATSISGTYKSIRNAVEKSGKKTKTREGVYVSDKKIKYGAYIDENQGEKGWIEYSCDGKSYRKSYDSKEFESYKNENFDKTMNIPKNFLEYVMSNVKNLKISSKSKNFYKITAKPNWKTDKFTSITFIVNKKTGRVTEVKLIYGEHEASYFSGETYTVTGGSLTYSDICYGDMELTLPDELLGL